ncbi:MAG: DUF4468 domain-containing protein [Bacteroidota bacterium]
MKKYLLLSAIVLIALNAFAQRTSKILTLGPDENYSYENTFDAPGKSKDEIFASIKSWVIKTVKTQSNTNYFDEIDKKSISTAPVFACSWGSMTNFKLNIDIKDGRYRISANSFIWYSGTTATSVTLGKFKEAGINKKTTYQIIDDVDAEFSKMLISIQSAIEKKSDW